MRKLEILTEQIINSMKKNHDMPDSINLEKLIPFMVRAFILTETLNKILQICDHCPNRTTCESGGMIYDEVPDILNDKCWTKLFE